VNIIIAILIFGFIVIFHEFGHFIVAKSCNVRVNEFMIGLGPRLFGKKFGETDFSIHLLPFGGACVMEGEEEDSEDNRSFQKKPVLQRFLIVAAGPVFNFILAYILSVVLIAGTGYTPPLVGGLIKDYPAEKAGIQKGDEIVKIDNYEVHFYQEVSYYSLFHPGKEVKLTYIHNGKKISTVLTPKMDKTTGKYLMGVSGGNISKKANIGECFSYGGYQVKELVYVTIQSLKMLFTGSLGINDMSGPVGIVKAVGDSYNKSVSYGFFTVLMQMIYWVVLLSANLGVVNLLPFPALDGGRLVFFIIEMFTRKKVPEKAEAIVNGIGFVILMALMVLVMGNDIRKIFIK